MTMTIAQSIKSNMIEWIEWSDADWILNTKYCSRYTAATTGYSVPSTAITFPSELTWRRIFFFPFVWLLFSSPSPPSHLHLHLVPQSKQLPAPNMKWEEVGFSKVQQQQDWSNECLEPGDGCWGWRRVVEGSVFTAGHNMILTQSLVTSEWRLGLKWILTKRFQRRRMMDPLIRSSCHLTTTMSQSVDHTWNPSSRWRSAG